MQGWTADKPVEKRLHDGLFWAVRNMQGRELMLLGLSLYEME
jgi:hypothetical protein